MSVLDQAIVKAFERRSQSVASEKQVTEAVIRPAPSVVSTDSELVELRSNHSITQVSATLPQDRVATANAVPETIPSRVKQAELPVSEWTTNTTAEHHDVIPVIPEVAAEVSHHPVNKLPVATPAAIAPSIAAFEIRKSEIPHPASTVPETRATNEDSVLFESAVTTAPNAVPTAVTRPQPSPENDQSIAVPAAPVGTGSRDTKAHVWQWPAICEQLDQYTGEGFRELARHLQYAAQQGHKVLAFASSHRDAGRTSVLLTLVRILALEGKSRVLLIDADHRHPHIASLASLKPKIGLQDVLQGSVGLQSAAIPMTPGKITLLPLNEIVSESEWAQRASAIRTLLKKVRHDYDIVLMDAGVFSPDTKLNECWLRGVVDAVVTVARQLTVQRTEHVVLDWKQIGIESLGVIETFA